MEGKTGATEHKLVLLDDKDCVRMTRNELTAVRELMGALFYIDSAKVELGKRLKEIDRGMERMIEARDALDALAADIVGTMTSAQCKQIRNTTKDMRMQIVPKLTPGSTNVILQDSQLKDLVTCAQEKCRVCTAMDEDARQCELYRVLEAVVPLDDYGNGLSCPYDRTEFE